MKNFMVSIFFPLYILFTLACGGWLLYEKQLTALRIWYQATAVIWLILAAGAMLLTGKIYRISRLKRKRYTGRSAAL